MSADESPVIEGMLPQEFWSAPEQFISDTSLRLLHAEVCSRLRSENPDASTLEQLAMERVASLYFFMRDREAAGTFTSSAASAYKSIMQLWVQMATDLRKANDQKADEGLIREQITGELVSAVRDALRGLEPEVQMTVKGRVARSLGVA